MLADHFYDIENRGIYKAIRCLVNNNIDVIDALNIYKAAAALDDGCDYTQYLTVDNLQELIAMSDTLARSSVEEYKMYAKNVMDAAFKRDMVRSLKNCIEICEQNNNELGISGREEVQQSVYRLIDETISQYSSADNIPCYAEQIDEMWEEIKQRQGEGYAGIPFKFPALNDYVTGERGELIIFGAQQKVGKSIMLLNIAADLLKNDYSVLYIDSELSTRLFTARMLTHLSGITYRNLTTGNYSSEEEQKIISAKEWLKTRKFTHIYMPFFDKETIYSTTKRVDHKQHIDVIIIDYFKSTGDTVNAYQTYAAMGRCVDLVKNDIAGAMNIVAIGAAQATASNKLADSAKIARNASTIIMLVDKTPEEIEMDGVECGNKKMIVTVNRNGTQMAQGEYIDVMFDGDKILYEQAPKQHIPNDPY